MHLIDNNFNPDELFIHNRATGETLKIYNPLFRFTDHIYFNKDCLVMQATTQKGKSWEIIDHKYTTKVEDYYQPKRIAELRGLIVE